jgi:tetratricopeptide (TPR) repeat protein
MIEPGRNDPCPCGSGLKYKKCCLGKNTTAVDSEADDITRLRVEAFKAMGDRKWDEALARFKELLPLVSDPHVIVDAMASCYDALEDYLRAAEYYEKALSQCPSGARSGILYRLGIARACAERPEKASDALRQCMDETPSEPDRERIAFVLALLEDVLAGRSKPEAVRIKVHLERAFSEMEDEAYVQAADRLQGILLLDQENPAILYNLGVVYTFLRKEDDALTFFRRCVGVAPQYAQAWYNMGQVFLIVKEDLPMALHCFTEAVTARPQYVSAHHQRGQVFELMGERQRALECWKKTLELDPSNKSASEGIRRLEAAGT